MKILPQVCLSSHSSLVPEEEGMMSVQAHRWCSVSVSHYYLVPPATEKIFCVQVPWLSYNVIGQRGSKMALSQRSCWVRYAQTEIMVLFFAWRQSFADLNHNSQLNWKGNTWAESTKNGLPAWLTGVQTPALAIASVEPSCAPSGSGHMMSLSS